MNKFIWFKTGNTERYLINIPSEKKWKTSAFKIFKRVWDDSTTFFVTFFLFFRMSYNWWNVYEHHIRLIDEIQGASLHLATGHVTGQVEFDKNSGKLFSLTLDSTHLVLGVFGSRAWTTINAWRKCEAIMSGEKGVFDSWNTTATMSLPETCLA